MVSVSIISNPSLSSLFASLNLVASVFQSLYGQLSILVTDPFSQYGLLFLLVPLISPIQTCCRLGLRVFGIQGLHLGFDGVFLCIQVSLQGGQVLPVGGFHGSCVPFLPSSLCLFKGWEVGVRDL